MKKRFVKPSSYIALATMLVLMVAQLLASGQDKGGKSQAGKLEGTWSVEIAQLNCQTGATIGTIQALNTYVRGGSMLETGNGSFFRSPGHGIWQHVGGRDFTATLTFFRFNAAGAFIGSARATKTIAVGDDGDEFTATTAVEIFDVNGILIGNACAADTAQRYE